jgi:hypothetical protein
MQLDSTQIAIRERRLLELLDLGLHVVRRYALPLAATMALGAVPMALLNAWLLGQLLPEAVLDPQLAFHYAWNMMLLVYLELPLAGSAATLFLGRAMFDQRPSWRQVSNELAAALPQLAWYQFLLRGVLAAWFVASLIDIGPNVGEVWLLLLAGWMAVMRGIRPYLNEVILLEQNPWKHNAGGITTRRRNRLLHAGSGGESFGNALALLAVAAALALAMWLSIWVVRGVLVSGWVMDRSMCTIWLPVSMWTVGGYVTVVRFLNYLDLRIRREGWEVELRLRAIAAELTGGAPRPLAGPRPEASP